MVTAILTGLGKALPFICKQQPRLNYKRRVYSAPMYPGCTSQVYPGRVHLEYLAWVMREAVPLKLTEQLLH